MLGPGTPAVLKGAVYVLKAKQLNSRITIEKNRNKTQTENGTETQQKCRFDTFYFNSLVRSSVTGCVVKTKHMNNTKMMKKVDMLYFQRGKSHKVHPKNTITHR